MTKPTCLLLFLMFASFLTRLTPYSLSDYPFNNDGLNECDIASDIVSSGALAFSEGSPELQIHSAATPALNVLLAFAAASLDTNPYIISQLLIAVVSALLVGVMFTLGRLFSGSMIGGVVSAHMSMLFGTFVFTTGSVWKVALGVAVFSLVVYAYVRRDAISYRALTMVLLLTLPLVHHLAAIVSIIFVFYLVVWSWYFAIRNGLLRRRHHMDAMTLAAASLFMIVYYRFVSFDRFESYTSPVTLLAMGVCVTLVICMAILVLRVRSHVKLYFAPFIGVAAFVMATLDYMGFVFPYSPSAPRIVVLLFLAYAFSLALGWYGSEIAIESQSRYRAVLLSLILAPLTIISLSLVEGFSLTSHNVFYRSFDFLDVPIFLGSAVGLVTLRRKNVRGYHVLGVVGVALLVVSFPFAYASEDLLGVRHDTQPYEVDAIGWLVSRVDVAIVVSDERLSYVCMSVFDLEKSNYLPRAISENESLAAMAANSFFMLEERWIAKGVNAYPNGLVTVPFVNYSWIRDAGSVLYVGGDVGDTVILIRGSMGGESVVYG